MENPWGVAETVQNNVFTTSRAMEKDMMDEQGFNQLSSVPAARENGGLSLVYSERGKLRNERLYAKALLLGAAGLCVSVLLLIPQAQSPDESWWCQVLLSFEMSH